MKQLKCELCGSNDLIKQNGEFVCQYCGCKYTLEEARKIMVEGPVDVSGSTVKVDSSDELKNLYVIARRAKDEENAENANKYYEMILMKDPASWEATFYTVYYQASQTKIAYITSAAYSVRNCLSSVFTLISKNEPKDNQYGVVKEVAIRCGSIAVSLAHAAKKHYYGTSERIRSQYNDEYESRVLAALDIVLTCAEQIEKTFGEKSEATKNAALAWKSAIKITDSNSGLFENAADDIERYHELIGKYDPDYLKRYLEEIAAKKPENSFRYLGVAIMIIGIVFICSGYGEVAIMGLGLLIYGGYHFFKESKKASKIEEDAIEAKIKLGNNLQDEDLLENNIPESVTNATEMAEIGYKECIEMYGIGFFNTYKDFSNYTCGMDNSGRFSCNLFVNTGEKQYETDEGEQSDFCAVVIIDSSTEKVFRDYENSILPQ